MTIWWWVAQHVATTALLVAAVALVCRLIPTRPALEHALWLVVLLKFLLPPVVVWPVAAPDFPSLLADRVESLTPTGDINASEIQPERAPRSDNKSRLAGQPSDTGHEVDLAEQPSTAKPLAAAMTSEFAVAGTSPNAIGPAADVSADTVTYDTKPYAPRSAVALALRSWGTEFTPVRLLCIAWLVGSVVVSIRHMRMITRYARLVREATAAPDYLSAESVRLAREFGVRQIPLFVVDGNSSPFVWCLGRLKLIWPATLADQTEFARWQGIMAHELAHVRRGDHWTAWLELTAGIIWWWNPLYLFTRRRLRESAEIACDALAVSTLPDGRRAYAEAFLALSLPPCSLEPVPALGVRSRDRKSFERRLSMILSHRVVSKISLPGLVTVAVLAIVAAPSWTRGQVEPASKPTAPTVEAVGPASNVPLVTTIVEEPGYLGAAVLPAVTENPSAGPQASATPAPAASTLAAVETDGATEPVTTPAANSDADPWPAATDEPKIKVIVGTTSEIVTPKKVISRAQILDLAIATVTQTAVHKIELKGRKIGSTTLNLWDDENNLKSFDVVVQTAAKNPQDVDTILLKSTGIVLKNPVVAAAAAPRSGSSTALLAGAQPAAPKAPVAVTLESATYPTQLSTPAVESAQPVPSAKTTTVVAAAAGSVEQLDVTSLGIALIEARGELNLAENQVSGLAEKYEHVGTNTSAMEIKAAKIQRETAKQKLDFLTKIVQTAYDEAMRELGDQRKLVARTKLLASQRAISSQQLEEAHRQLNTAAARLKALEAFPGIKIDDVTTESNERRR
ncbi:MAG TPA: M56 family metallopeptidase [Pirellulales bacterium]